MAADPNSSISTSDTIEEVAERGGAALKEGMNAARTGFNGARKGLDYAQEHVNDGVDYVLEMIPTVNEVVTRQPLLAVGGAFLIGYIAVRLMRRVSSSS
ncbi:MAG: hypothetical protein ACLQU2_04720 [Candidatus Binataceae bacterium]